MRTARQALGQESERLARRALEQAGYAIEQANARNPAGEIDFVARQGNALVFVEVRSTRSDAWGGPQATIRAAKQRRMVRAARWYLARHPAAAGEIRFDVVLVRHRADGMPEIDLLPGAIESPDAVF
jgi:putative endonuclease